ncbi:MAG: hypothetical protein ACI4AK_05855 [Lepagella sp.]
MARIARSPIRRRQQVEEEKHKCAECAHSYDWQNRSFDDGHLILCRCNLDAKSRYGRYLKFLSDTGCPQFKIRLKDAPDYGEAH